MTEKGINKLIKEIVLLEQKNFELERDNELLKKGLSKKEKDNKTILNFHNFIKGGSE